MARSLHALVSECCQILTQDAAELPNRGESNPALDCFLEIAAMSCIGAQPWAKAPKASDNSIIHKLICERQHLQVECPLLAPFFIFRNDYPSENAVKKVYACLRKAIGPEAWRADHILGWLYQAALQGTPEQKQHGQFYTPKPIVDAIAAQTLTLTFDESQSLSSPSFTILDLACGAGGFALKVFEELYQWYANKDPRTSSDTLAARILAAHLYLVDNDPRACQLAALNLYIKAKQLAPSCQIYSMNIVCADALRRWEHASFSPSTEEEALNKRFFAKHHDIIIGNPPYIVLNRRQIPADVIASYTSYQSAAFKLNTFALFVERGIELLKSQGILGMIVPNTLFTQVYFAPLRQYILMTSRIRSILDTKRVFDQAFVENCIIVLQREENQRERYHNMMKCWMKKPRRVQNISRKAVQEPDLKHVPVIIPQRHFEHAPLKMFNVHIDEQSRALMEKIARENPKLGELCESHDGFNPGNAKVKFIVSEPMDETCRKILNGKDIGRYCLNWGKLYVRYNKQLLTKDDTVRWGHFLSLESPKILTRQTADRLIGAYDSGEYYVTNSIHTTIMSQGVQEVQLKYILAILNSKLMSFYYQKLIAEVGQVFSQVKLINLRQLPIKLISEKGQQEIIDLVEQLLQPNTPDLIFQETDAYLDHKIYDLYQLTPAEIETIEYY